MAEHRQKLEHFMSGVERRNPGEPEFLQAVRDCWFLSGLEWCETC